MTYSRCLLLDVGCSGYFFFLVEHEAFATNQVSPHVSLIAHAVGQCGALAICLSGSRSRVRDTFSTCI